MPSLTSLYSAPNVLSPFPQSPSPDFSDWADSPYEKNTNYPEGLKFETNFGLYVRSKSESMIAMMLHTYHIPFRYECALELGGLRKTYIFETLSLH